MSNLIVTITEPLPHGQFDTVIPFEATTDEGRSVVVGVDHRAARDILQALRDTNSVRCQVESWQLL